MTYIQADEVEALAALARANRDSQRVGYDIDRDYEISGVREGLLRVSEIMVEDSTVEVQGSPGRVRLPTKNRRREWLVAADGTIELRP